MSLPFLLEIGIEEVPDWMIPDALENLRLLFEKLSIPFKSVTVDATPRRLVLRAEGLPERQSDSEERVLGPAKAAPPQAVAGFARKQGIKPEDLEVDSTPRGEYWAFTRKTAGRRTLDILAESLPGVVLGIYFPKTMYWTGKGGPRFIRPIRWIVALLGDQVVPFEIAGVKSGNQTSGHRRLGAPRIAVTTAGYEETLLANCVILSAAERRKRIEDGLKAAGAKADASLLEVLVYITEFPAPITGSFDPEFLALPEEVLVTVMRHHQKYFSVEEGGKLAPRFVAIMNTAADPEGFVRRGNERVLRARFNDARFFWDTDQKKSLAARVEDLGHVTFQAKLGSYLDKARRMVELVRDLGGDEAAQRAALLCKCDLTTELVKEFTELQGVVGGLYARAQGEPDTVWQAIYDHYRPESMDDSIPRNHVGQIVSLADKLDSLRGCFRVGLVPTGSRDPFALRRAAQGAVRILVEGGIALPLRSLVAGDQQLLAFFEERVRFYFKDHLGFRYDEVNAAMAPGWNSQGPDWTNLVDLKERLTRLRALRATPDFEPLAASFKRIRNILGQAQTVESGAPEAALIEAGPERELYEEYLRIQGQPIESVISSLRPKVDLFFDKVLVNAPDARVRQNRLKLLSGLIGQFSSIADFSEIVTQS
jgi:glycyl-tRNA synthetase beta chain